MLNSVFHGIPSEIVCMDISTPRNIDRNNSLNYAID
jgi:hypothetical protein